jgi:hypothetical protein
MVAGLNIQVHCSSVKGLVRVYGRRGGMEDEQQAKPNQNQSRIVEHISATVTVRGNQLYQLSGKRKLATPAHARCAKQKDETHVNSICQEWQRRPW